MTLSALDVTICEKARLSRDARFDGKFFTAVLTTGIFCRPICPARPPKSENVQYYISAEQAQHAGFVPCKRCFPEQAPNQSLPITLKKMITSFDYRTDSIASLANKFSLSTRQVQRLFTQSLGISPSEYFQQQRLLLARKLLSSTTLPISDVCYASGFNSLRRFNEVIKTKYKCTPISLRKKEDKKGAEHSIEINLHYRPPFDWAKMLSFFQHRQITEMESVTTTHYRRSVLIDKCSGWLEVCQHASKPVLVLRVSLSDYSYLNNVIYRVRRMFDLDADMTLIHKTLSQHPILNRVIAQAPGLRLPGCWDIVEFTIRAILGQQVSVKAATTLAQRIATRYGPYRPELPSDIQYCFPTLSELNNAEFEGIGLTKSRIETLKTWVEFFSKNENIFDQYQSIDALEQQLCTLKGIGPWTVNYIAMRGLSDPDAFPSADLGIIKALTENDIKPKNKDILLLAEKWRPWRAYAAIYLWHSLSMKN